MNDYDVIVIGGGINGAGIAADAAGRGLSVLLAEAGDLAGATSSASSKLIHGGLRYLEQFELRLVREALAEREILLYKAPHIVRPLRFVLPHRPRLRPAWTVGIGLWLYDHLARRSRLPSSRRVRFDTNSPLRDEYRIGFEYADCAVDDSRLVVLNALTARAHGAEVVTRSPCLAAVRGPETWELTLGGALPRQVRGRVVVNATGPWAERFSAGVLGHQAPAPLRLVKGSHLIVPRLYEGSQAYILQNHDGRIVFVIPYRERYTLIGTTDQDYTGDPSAAAISEAETGYLLEACNTYFRRQLHCTEVVASFAGVRALYSPGAGQAQRASRDYRLLLDRHGAPLLSVYGGKLTTYRRLAEAALARLEPYLPAMGPSWTAAATLPGGDIVDPETYAEELRLGRPWLPAALAQRYAHCYGSRAELILGDAGSLEDLGQDFGAGLTAAEVNYLCSQEWACSAEDILWRRTKLGLEISDSAALSAYLPTYAAQEST